MMFRRTAAIGGAIIAIASTLGAGTPHVLPDIALSSAALFHLERVGALLVGYMFVLVILVRAWRGELPVEMSSQGIKYAAANATDAAQYSLAAVIEDLEHLRARLDRLEGDA